MTPAAGSSVNAAKWPGDKLKRQQEIISECNENIPRCDYLICERHGHVLLYRRPSSLKTTSQQKMRGGISRFCLEQRSPPVAVSGVGLLGPIVVGARKNTKRGFSQFFVDYTVMVLFND